MIAGFYKVSYVDYPAELSSVIFLAGCNFKCPWCHNQTIVKGEQSIDTNYVIEQLLLNKSLIQHVVITGGEPTLHGSNLIELLKLLKKNNFKIKLDTNGTNPDLLKKVIEQKLIDYIAMDIKNTWLKYNITTNTEVNINNIKKSIKLIENSDIDYQFRTTCNQAMHTIDDTIEIKSYLQNTDNYKLQNYRYSSEQLIDKDFGSVNYIKKDE